jgi:hypothetical protein
MGRRLVVPRLQRLRLEPLRFELPRHERVLTSAKIVYPHAPAAKLIRGRGFACAQGAKTVACGKSAKMTVRLRKVTSVGLSSCDFLGVFWKVPR